MPDASETYDITDDVFLPDLSQFQNERQPESTFDLDCVPPTSSIAVLANAQTISPLRVKFKAIEDTVKTEFCKLLSSPNTFLSGFA